MVTNLESEVLDVSCFVFIIILKIYQDNDDTDAIISQTESVTSELSWGPSKQLLVNAKI